MTDKMPRGPHVGLDHLLNPLRSAHHAPEPLFIGPDGGAITDHPLPGGVMLRVAPEARLTGHWASPRGRLLELKTTVQSPGPWLGLHLPLTQADFVDTTWLCLALRSSAAGALSFHACLRSGLEGGGFRDDFFPRAILAQPREADHVDMLGMARLPGLPWRAPWRELVLFLPPATDAHLALHELRLVTL